MIQPFLSLPRRRSSAASGDATITFITRLDSSSTVSALSFEHTSVSLGSSAYLLVALAGAGTAGTVSSIEIQDSTPTYQACTIISNGSATSFGCMGMIANPNIGGTSNIRLTRSANITRYSGALFAVTNIATLTNHATANTTTWTANAATINFDVPAGGIAAAVTYNIGTTAGASFTWTGLTERSDAVIHSNRNTSTASDAFASANTPLAVTATGVTTVTGCLFGASWSK